ncbi:hypothetical protein MSIMFI_05432 [Mycobacterium simulans]|nr:hypothetical protein MSIMFI_05432 [Mycobacterium simulans]
MRSGLIEVGSGWASTVAVVVTTRVVRVWSCWSGVWVPSCAVRVLAVAVAAWGRAVVSADRIGGKVLVRARRSSARELSGVRT